MKEREREREREREGQTDRQAGRQTERQIDRRETDLCARLLHADAAALRCGRLVAPLTQVFGPWRRLDGKEGSHCSF